MQESAPAKALSLPEDFDIRSYITKKRAEPGQNQSVRRHNLTAWVALWSRCQWYRCRQALLLDPILHACKTNTQHRFAIRPIELRAL